MAADVTFVFGRRERRPKYALPTSAVGEDRDGRFVFKVERPRTASASCIEPLSRSVSYCPTESRSTLEWSPATWWSRRA